MNKLGAALLSFASLLYPFVWYIGRERGWFGGLALGMAVLWLLRGVLQHNRLQKTLSFLVATFFVMVLLLDRPDSLYWYPVAVNVLMLAVFGGSLFAGQTVVERLARLQTPDLPPEGVRYTRRVTQIWCVFFVLNGAVSAGLAWFAYYDWWAFYTGVLSYVLMAALMGGEFLFRKRFVQK